MEVNEVEQMINKKVDSSLRRHRQEMLRDIAKIVEKISGSSNVTQLNNLSTLVNGGEKFKRKSNEEQFKYNSSVSRKLEDAEQSLVAHKLQEGRDKTAEGIGLKDNQKQMQLGEVGVCETTKDTK